MAIIERSGVIAGAGPADFVSDGAVSSNDFAGQCRVGDHATDQTNGVLYVCTATNGSTTSTWVAQT